MTALAGFNTLFTSSSKEKCWLFTPKNHRQIVNSDFVGGKIVFYTHSHLTWHSTSADQNRCRALLTKYPARHKRIQTPSIQANLSSKWGRIQTHFQIFSNYILVDIVAVCTLVLGHHLGCPHSFRGVGLPWVLSNYKPLLHRSYARNYVRNCVHFCLSPTSGFGKTCNSWAIWCHITMP